MAAKREVVAPPVACARRSAVWASRPRRWCGAAHFLFVSGLTAVDPQSGERVRGTTASETRADPRPTCKQLLEAAGSSLDKVVKVNVLLHSMLEAPNMNEVYARFFPDPPPARTVCGARLPDGVKVIIECTALA